MKIYHKLSECMPCRDILEFSLLLFLLSFSSFERIPSVLVLFGLLDIDSFQSGQRSAYRNLLPPPLSVLYDFIYLAWDRILSVY
jgi:hypothetical protein